jgi:hypothetical protein
VAEQRRLIALKILWEYYGTLYKWGGDDPSGLDCSGFMIEILQSVGILPHKSDTTAHGLMKRFALNEVREDEAESGCLVFFLRKTDHKAVHVEMVVGRDGDKIFCMGASGGDSDTKTAEDAIKDNAFIKVRPVTYRRGPRAFMDPFREE